MEIAETTKEIVIKTELERVIARMNLKGAFYMATVNGTMAGVI